jgi:choline dehydrogenase-like flavoprotein
VERGARMIIDLDERDAGEVIESDLCIAGSGAAGLSIALQFIDQGRHDVVVLEAGDRDYTEASQEIYQGRNLGLEYFDLDVTRLRYFGGSTNHWFGWCRPLDPLDFQVRPWVPHSGWPIGPEDIAPFRAEAHKILDLAGLDYAPENVIVQTEGLFQFDPELLVHKLWRFSPPTRFKDKYEVVLEQSEAVTLYLNASVTDVELTPDGRRVVGFEVRTGSGKRLQVRSRHHVLALGGLENPRIMLNATSGNPKGLGNLHDVVGRYFMEHPHGAFNELLIERDLDRGYAYVGHWGRQGQPIRPAICVTEAAQRKYKILNHSLTTRLYPHRTRSEGFRALLDLTGTSQDADDDDFWQDVWELIKDVDGAAKGVYNVLSGVTEVPPQETTVYTRSEQAPNPDSRVVLIDQVDSQGLRRIGLDWRLGELDKYTMRTASEIFAREIGRQGLGRVKLPEWLLNDDPKDWGEDLIGGHHHMGTTRMAADPRRGVVDQDCRVHGVENLYIAGSSVFPTGGFANPTLTIVELALRLAQHLKQSL